MINEDIKIDLRKFLKDEYGIEPKPYKDPRFIEYSIYRGHNAYERFVMDMEALLKRYRKD